MISHIVYQKAGNFVILYAMYRLAIFVGVFFGTLLTKSLIGALFGGLIGYFFSRGLRGTTQHSQVQAIFFKATFTIMGHIAKADGRVSESEIAAAKNLMQHLQLAQEQRLQAMRYFQEGKAPQFRLADALDELAETCRLHPHLLQLFTDIQCQAALADGLKNEKKQRILQQMCERFGLMHLFHHYTRQTGSHTYQQPPRNDTLRDDYALLEVDKTATDKEVKRAYRRLMSQHHPDKLIAEGLPEEMIKLATEKTQQIRAAYDRIRQARQR